MLIQFAFENFRSVRERVVWDLRASDHLAYRPEQVVEVEGVGRVLKVAGIYGANASGKSTIVQAWRFFTELVTEGRRPDAPIGRTPFKLDAHSGEVCSGFEAIFAVDGDVWTYGVEVTNTTVETEWLLRGEETVFERTAPKDAVTWGAVDDDRRPFLDFVALGTRANQPLLAELREKDSAEVLVVWRQLGRNSRVVLDPPIAGFAGELAAEGLALSTRVRTFVVQQLQRLGTGVVGIRFRSQPHGLAERLNRGGDLTSDGTFRDVSELVIREKLEARFVHRGEDAANHELLFDELSDGTRRALELLLLLGPALVAASAPNPAFIDELDRSFHPALSLDLLRLLLEGDRVQLLFTTHDTNLLDAGILGPDGIWFVEKDAAGATKLYSLAEFDPDQLNELTGHLEEGYLAGRFGAIPFIGPRRQRRDKQPLFRDVAPAALR